MKKAKASRCGRWLTAAKAASWFSGVMRSTCAPIAAQTSVAFCTSSGEVFGSGVRMTCRPAVERRVGVRDAGDFLAGDRVRRHERADPVLEDAPRRIDHVALGGADVHDQHARLDEMADRLERGFGRGHRHRDQHDVGARYREQGRLGRRVDDAEAACAFSVVEGDLL